MDNKRKKNEFSNRPNPQGKGLVPVLDSLTESRAVISVPPKQIHQVANELFTSLFVLHSRFQFKPVVGKSYWLYLRNNSFQLSMIAPHEWGGNSYGQYIGECVLQNDVTWTLNLDTKAAQDKVLMKLIENKRKEFEKTLRTADVIESVLPVYLETLPFYKRVFASALANSLRMSMNKSGIMGLDYAQAKRLLLKKD